MSDQSKNQSIGGLYKKTSVKSGLQYLDGFVEVGGKRYKILVFKNTGEKKSDKTPDYSIVEKKDFGGGSSGGSGGGGKPAYNNRNAAPKTTPKPQPKRVPATPEPLDDEAVEPGNAAEADETF